MWENVGNTALHDRLLKEVALYGIDQAYYIQTPRPYLYRLWWPWVKGYNGEWTVGFGSSSSYNFPIYIWYDQALKKEMTGVR